MVKKITKYAKFVVCCALILSLVAPSYAALSASDGSAFVTKAEFDSALADFNARLTTFEAGINSKIDSQVTSYLDRNGIWNGKEQELNLEWSNAAFYNVGTDLLQRSSSPVETIGFDRTKSFNAGNHTVVSQPYAWHLKSTEYGSYKPLIRNLSKSGLLMSTIYLRFASTYKTLKRPWNAVTNSFDITSWNHANTDLSWIRQLVSQLNSYENHLLPKDKFIGDWSDQVSNATYTGVMWCRAEAWNMLANSNPCSLVCDILFDMVDSSGTRFALTPHNVFMAPMLQPQHSIAATNLEAAGSSYLYIPIPCSMIAITVLDFVKKDCALEFAFKLAYEMRYMSKIKMGTGLIIVFTFCTQFLI